MNIQHNDFPFYHIVIDEVFSKSILPSIYEEINLLKKEFKPPEFTESAKQNGKILKKNKGIFLQESKIFGDLKIINHIDNISKKVGHDNNWKNKTFQRMYKTLMWGSDLLNHYSSDDYYLPHFDGGIFSMVTFLYENYDIHEGGDLHFPEHNYTHKCKNNQSIIFFAKEIHEVTKLKGDENINRYSIVTFSKYNEQLEGRRSYSDATKEFNNILYT